MSSVDGTGGERAVLSIVIPCFNEEGNIFSLLARLKPVLGCLQLSFEVIFVDDGSRDGSCELLRSICASDKRIKAIFLSRNFGKEMALTAGLKYARGSAVIPMDADLQHPPELIPGFVAEWRKGADVVIGVRRSRKTDPFFRKLASKFFFKFFNALSDTEIVDGGGDFRLLDRKVVDVLNKFPERTRFLKGIYAWLGFCQVTIPFDVEPRRDGKTTFSLRSLFRYAIDAVISFSTFPLRVWTFLGAGIIAVGSCYGAYIAVDVLLHGRAAPGFASLVVLVVVFGGIQFLSLGIMGEYLGRILVEVKARPQFIVREAIGVDLPDVS